MSKDNEQPLMNHKLRFAPFKKASEGYFLAKSQMTDCLDHRIEILRDELKTASIGIEVMSINSEIKLLETFRNYVRNGMLWNTEWGK